MPIDVILAGASVRSLAESALSDGLQPFCVDMFGDADLHGRLAAAGLSDSFLRISDFSEIPKATEPLDPAVPLVWSGGLENRLGLIDEIARKRRVCGATPDIIRQVRNLDHLRRLTEGCDVQLPQTREIAELHTTAGLPDGNWLWKPRGSAGGIGIATVLPRHPETGYLQQRVPGMPMSATFFASDGCCEFIGATRQIIGDRNLGGHGFQFCGNVGPVVLSDDVEHAVRQTGDRLQQAGLRGVFGIDFVVDHSQVWLIEVNPRLTASHEFFDRNLKDGSLLRRQLGLCHDATRSDGPSPQSPCGRLPMLARCIVYSRRNGQLSDQDVNQLLHGTRGTFRGDSDDCVSGVWIADVPQPGPFSAGQPFCSLYVSSDAVSADSVTADGQKSDRHRDPILSTVAGHTGLFHPDAQPPEAFCSGLFERAQNTDNRSCTGL